MKLQWTSKELHDANLDVWFRPDGMKAYKHIPFPFFIDLASKKLEYVVIEMPDLNQLEVFDESNKVDPKNPPGQITEDTVVDAKVITAEGDIIISNKDKQAIATTDKRLWQSGPIGNQKKN